MTDTQQPEWTLESLVTYLAKQIAEDGDCPECLVKKRCRANDLDCDILLAFCEISVLRCPIDY